MKKNYSVIFILLAFIMAITSFLGRHGLKAYADEDHFNNKSKASYLIDAKTKTIIHEDNINTRLPIASMCKIMTLLLCFEAIENGQISLDQSITVSENAAGMGGSQVFLECNGEYLVSNLLKSITVASANDACVAMAETISGSEQEFTAKMNERARQLCMENTNFINCTGLPGVGQYSSAKDVSIMFNELIKHQDFFKFSKIWTDEISHSNERKTMISNTNKLIRYYEGCDCGKTGYTAEAGHCLVASAVRGNTRLIAVVISAPDSKTRFKEVSNMFNYGFNNYTTKTVIDNLKPLDIDVEIINGKKEQLSVVAERSLYIFGKKTDKNSFDFEFLLNGVVKAPIKVGDEIGILNVFQNNVLIDSVKVLSAEDVLRKSYIDNLGDVAKNWELIG